MPSSVSVFTLSQSIADGVVSLRPRAEGPTDLAEIKALIQLLVRKQYNPEILDIKQFSFSPPHLDDKFETEWKNNFVNRILHNHFRGRYPEHLYEESDSCDTEDDAFSA